MTRALLILLPILLNGCNSEPAPPPDANVRVVPSGDAVMSKAIADAKANLSTFKEFLANPPKGSYLGVKVKMTAPTGTEHIWITDVSFANGKVKGKLDNDPVYLSKKNGRLGGSSGVRSLGLGCIRRPRREGYGRLHHRRDRTE